MMNDFNLEDFTLGEELEKIINSQQEIAKDAIEESYNNDPFAMNTINVQETTMFEDPFATNAPEDSVQNEGDIFETVTNAKEIKIEGLFENDIFETDDIFEINGASENNNVLDNTNPFDIQGDINNNHTISDLGDLGQDRYINAMHAFVDYMPINLSVDRDIPAYFESLVDLNSDLPTIVVEKLPNKMISLIHNLRKRPLPAIPTENRQPVVRWNGTIQEFMNKLEESVTFTHGFDEEEFKAMKKVIIVEDMNEKTDLDQNEIYVTRQDIVDSLLNKYNSIIDLTDERCSINFKDNGKKYSFNIGGLGYNCNINTEWVEEIRSKIVFMRSNQILLTGIAASPNIVHTLKETHGFNIVNEANEIKSLAAEI